MEIEKKPETPVTPLPQYVSVKVLYQAVLAVSLAMSVFSLVIYDRFFTVKIASFDLPGYVMQLREAEAANTITQEQSDKLLKSLRDQIDSLPPKYVVISGDAILGNAPKVERLNLR